MALSVVYADEAGRMYIDDKLIAVGRNGPSFLELGQVVPLPPGASMVVLPGRAAVGRERSSGRIRSAGESKWAVGALLPAGYVRTLLPAYKTLEDPLQLPFFGYTAVGACRGRLYAAALPIDDLRYRWSPRFFNMETLPRRIARMQRLFPDNRLIEHLSGCALRYQCFTAQNLFYERWEAGIPSSRRCNARCLGCISEQEGDVPPAPHSRIGFTPTKEEIVELAARHLDRARDGIISFGQGCEGEPSLESRLLAEAVMDIRRRTHRGTININTNGGSAADLARLVDAGLDSMRVSLFSAREENFNAYHRPRGYALRDVANSIRLARSQDVVVSLNLLTFPGFTDRREEVGALVDFIGETGIQMVQLRNLSADPGWLAEAFPMREKTLGIQGLIRRLKAKHPHLRIGSFTHPAASFRRRGSR